MIRKISAVVAVIILIYEGSQILTVPTGGLTFLEFIWTQGNVNLKLACLAAYIALFVLLLLAFEKTRYILEEQRIEELRKIVEDAVPWLKKVERRHQDLAHLQTELGEIDVRIRLLGSPSGGFAELYREVNRTCIDVNREMQRMGRDESGNDFLGLTEQLAHEVENTGRRIRNLEAAAKFMPELSAAIEGFESRAESLKVDRGVLIAEYTRLRRLLDKVFDDCSIGIQETPRGSEVGPMTPIGESGTRIQTGFDKVFLRQSGKPSRDE